MCWSVCVLCKYVLLYEVRSYADGVFMYPWEPLAGM